MFASGVALMRSWSSKKVGLAAAGVFLLVALGVLWNVEIFPWAWWDFSFFAVLAFLITLYRPGWAFLLFLVLLPLETVDIAPEGLGVSLRPYQLLGAWIAGAVVLRAAAGRLSFSLVRPSGGDVLVGAIVIGGFLAAGSAPEQALAFKQALVVLSFGILYWVGRQFLYNAADVWIAAPFFLVSGVWVSVYALWQNVRFTRGAEAFEVMPGRPNAFFAEADWLGMYLVVLMSVVYAMLFAFGRQEGAESRRPPVSRKERWFVWCRENGWLKMLLWVLLVAIVMALVLSVARSAWLGAAASTVLFAGAAAVRGYKEEKGWRVGGGYAIGVGLALAVSIGLIHIFQLTSFELLNRAQSTASGLQKITIACEEDGAVPEQVATVEELASYGCAHINLEEIEAARASGKTVREIYRNDPNVDIRKRIYQTVFSMIGEHPVLGIGWGGASRFLGSDERGAGLNASNAFLEVWLGSGFLGFAAFVVLWGGALVCAARAFWKESSLKRQAVALFVVLSGAGMSVFNLFNSGILLGFVWVWLAIAALFLPKCKKSI
jgi:hypothetical protein